MKKKIKKCRICNCDTDIFSEDAARIFNGSVIYVCEKCQNKYSLFNPNTKCYNIRSSGKIKNMKEAIFMAKLIKNKL